MNEPVNFLFFFVPMAILVGLFFIVVNVNMKEQPFGFKIENEIDETILIQLKKLYYKKVICFSSPIIIIIPIISIFIRSFPVGAILLTVSVLTLATVNFIFYLQGYNKIKNM